MEKLVKITKCIECPNTYYKYGIEGHVEIGKPWCSQLDIELTERTTTIHKDCPLASAEANDSKEQSNCNLPQVSKRLILENLLERMQAVYPEYYLGIIQDELDGLNGC